MMETYNNLYPKNLDIIEICRIEQNSPKPHAVHRNYDIYDQQPELGAIYHGIISCREARNLLRCEPEGSYLVRRSQSSNNNFFTLTLKFNNRIHHYKLYHDKNQGFYVNRRRFKFVESLVEEGLFVMYLRLKNPNLYDVITENAQSEAAPQLITRNYKTLPCRIKPTQDCATTENLPDLLKSAAPKKKLKDAFYNFVCWRSLHTISQHENLGIPRRVPNLSSIGYDVELRTFLQETGDKIPFIITKCLEEIESRGINTLGIYRESGNANTIQDIEKRFCEKGKQTNLEAFSDIHCITGVLKKYLQKLPRPLITDEIYPVLLRAMSKEKLQISFVKIAINFLEKDYYVVLKHFMNHLNRVSDKKNGNQMGSQSLAKILAPTLLPKTIELRNLNDGIRLIGLMIEEYDTVFNR